MRAGGRIPVARLHPVYVVAFLSSDISTSGKFVNPDLRVRRGQVWAT